MNRIYFLLVGLVGAVLILQALPYLTRPLLESTSFSQMILDRNGRLLRLRLSGDEKYRIFTPLEKVSPQFVEALLLLEDKHFYNHTGVNPWSLLKAAYSTYVKGEQMGGSTLTMQLARIKNRIYSRTWHGKLTQIVESLKLELFYSKREILEAYLNLAPYGGNIEGIGAASYIYFEKAPDKLTLSEILSLVVVPQSPQLRSLAGLGSGQNLVEARERLYQNWLSLHPGSKDSVVDLNLPLQSRRLKELPFKAPHFVQYVGETYPSVLHFQSTLDLGLQNWVEGKIQSYVEKKSPFGIRNAAALLVNHETMEVLAWVGSADFWNAEIQGQVDGVLAERSPGSTVKPFVYAMALEQGLIHPQTLMKDTPSSFGAFDPENFDRKFAGPLSATQALVQSRNIPAIYLASRLRSPTLFEFFQQAGVRFPRDEKYYGLSIALGGKEFSMKELVEFYSMLARRGSLAPLKFNRAEKPTGTQLLYPEAAYATLQMLIENPRDEAVDLKNWQRTATPIAWKTGTSPAYHDAWTVGVVGPYTLAVWLGNFDNEPNPAFIGRELAAPLFFEIVDGLPNKNLPGQLWSSRAGLKVKNVKVCSVSGDLPGPHCHSQKDTLFIPGHSPITTCGIHREIMVSKKTGLRLCAPGAGEAKVFEFWPSDLLTLFRQAGVSRRPPPGFDPSCNINDQDENEPGPQITSPKQAVNYQMSVSGGDSLNTIPFRAISQSGDSKLYWFLGSQYVGSSEPDKSLLWRAEPGHYILRVVNSRGQSDARELNVQVVR